MPDRRGAHVHLRRLERGDAEAFVDSVRRSRSLHRPWGYPPDTLETFAEEFERRRPPTHEPLVVCRNEDGALAGCYTLSQIWGGAFCNAYLGYYAFVPYAGRGYMREAMDLVFRFAFVDLGLHRLQANVQPANARSIALLRATGWREEGLARRYLKIGGRWRDHVMFAILAEDAQRRRS